MADVPQTETHAPTHTETPVLTITPAAAAKVRALMVERSLEDYALRVFVQGGGCSGLSYGMAFENRFFEQDHIVESDGVKLVIDPRSLDYMRGSEIDFVDSLMGGGFAINNPNAVASCGCGHSFRTADDDAEAASAGGGCNCGHH